MGKKKHRGPTWGRFRFTDAAVEEELFAHTEIDMTRAREHHPYYSVQGPKRLSDENRILETEEAEKAYLGTFLRLRTYPTPTPP